MFFKNLQIEGGDGVAGGILMSCPVFDPDNVHERDLVYYGEDRSKYKDMSIFEQTEGRKIPAFIFFAEYDPPGFDDATIQLLNYLWKRDKESPFFKQIIDHNHISEILQFNTGDQSIDPDILSFIRSRNAIK